MRLVGIILLVLSLFAAADASAHPATQFSACAKPRGVAGEPCARRTEAGVGTKVLIRGAIDPPHAGALARVWQLRPHGSWEKADWVKASYP